MDTYKENFVPIHLFLLNESSWYCIHEIITQQMNSSQYDSIRMNYPFGNWRSQLVISCNMIYQMICPQLFCFPDRSLSYVTRSVFLIMIDNHIGYGWLFIGFYLNKTFIVTQKYSTNRIVKNDVTSEISLKDFLRIHHVFVIVDLYFTL
jgi:hypothetical protein